MRIEDPGAELLDRATGVWNRYGKVFLIAAGVLLAGGAIAFLTIRARTRSESQAAGQLAQANIMYWQGEYGQSMEAARQVIQLYPSAPSGIDAHRLVGDNAYWTGDFKTAVSEYREYLKHRKNGVLADAVRRSLAYSLESEHQYAEAATLYEGLVGVFDRESSAEFLSASARCYRALGQNGKAIERLQRVVDEFGSTSYASMARVELGELQASAH